MLVVLLVLSVSLGVGLAACGGGKHVEETENATITVSRGDSDEAIAITVTPKSPESNDSPDITPTMTCTATPTPLPEPALTTGNVFCSHRGCYNGAMMYDLYNFYANYTDENGNLGWWNEKGFSYEKFLGMIMMYEMGPHLDAEPFVIAAAGLQIWAHVLKDMTPAPYCIGSICKNGMFNFLAAYCESAQRRYDTVFRGIPSGFNPLDFPYTPGLAPGVWNEQVKKTIVDYFNQKAPSIGSAILNINANPSYRIYSNDKAYHWGNFAGDYSDYIYRSGTFYVLSANQRARISEMPISVDN